MNIYKFNFKCFNFEFSEKEELNINCYNWEKMLILY